MHFALEAVQSFVVPAVMVSANGLLCLAFYNRLSAVLTRSRTINKERFDLLTRLAGQGPQAEPAAVSGQLARRIEILDELGHQLYRRAQLVRGTLVCLLVSVLCMLGCSLALGLAGVAGGLALAALLLFVAGAVCMMLGISLAIRELSVALDPLLFEHEQMEESSLFPPGEG